MNIAEIIHIKLEVESLIKKLKEYSYENIFYYKWRVAMEHDYG